MQDQSSIRIHIGTWDRLKADATPIRHQVFVLEQHVPEDLEIDDMDEVSIHAVAYDAAGFPLGTGRLLTDGHIGRMAVLKAARGTGVGSQILSTLIAEARGMGFHKVALHAQLHAMPFYERHGFVAEGEPFDDAGIQHEVMMLDLSGKSSA